MANSNPLILLPIRHTAQAPHDSLTLKPAKSSSDDDSFEQKLERAKKQKLHQPIRKQIAETPAKPAAVKEVSGKPAKPTAKATEQIDPKTETQTTEVKSKIAKPENLAQTDDQPGSGDKPAAETKQPTLPVVQEQAAHLAVEKKPVKVLKPASAKTAATQDPKSAQLITATPTSRHAVKTTENDGADAPQKAAVTAIGDDKAETDDNQADAFDDKATSEFGTGKVATPGKTPAASSNSPSDQTPTEAATAQAAAVADLAQPAAILGPTWTTTAASQATGAVDLKLDTSINPVASDASPISGGTTVAAATGKPAIPQAQFVEENHPKIITSIQGQLLPHGGSLQIRLDPPELGALSVTVHLKDGVMTASFETSSDEATKLLSHSLGQLKAGLEAAGVTVDKIHVEQAPKRDSSNDSETDNGQAPQEQQQQAKQDQQRREMLQKMWQKLSGGDPLDLVA